MQNPTNAQRNCNSNKNESKQCCCSSPSAPHHWAWAWLTKNAEKNDRNTHCKLQTSFFIFSLSPCPLILPSLICDPSPLWSGVCETRHVQFASWTLQTTVSPMMTGPKQGHDTDPFSSFLTYRAYRLWVLPSYPFHHPPPTPPSHHPPPAPPCHCPPPTSPQSFLPLECQVMTCRLP